MRRVSPLPWSDGASALVAHPGEEAVDGEVELREVPRVGLLVGIVHRHARVPVGEGLYELVLADVEGYVPLLLECGPRVRAERHRPRLPRAIRVEVEVFTR